MKLNKKTKGIIWVMVIVAIILVIKFVFLSFLLSSEDNSYRPLKILTGSNVDGSDYILDIERDLDRLNIEGIGQGINL